MLSTWMSKGKGGMLNRVLAREKRLYLTLDFNTQILCIHTSAPVAFQDILEVAPLGSPQREANENCAPAGTGCNAYTNVDASATKISCFPWSHSHTGMTLHVKGGKKQSLYCSSAAEASCWIAALRRAMSEATPSKEQDESSLEDVSPPLPGRQTQFRTF